MQYASLFALQATGRSIVFYIRSPLRLSGSLGKNANKNRSIKIANAEGKHILAIRDIYTHHVLYGIDSFEIDPSDTHGILVHLEKARSPGLPWVVTLQEDKVAGYCYLTRYRKCYAYRCTLEDSIYIVPTAQRQGVGEALLRRMIGRAEAQGYRQLITITGDSDNQGSLRIHQWAELTRIGTLKNAGFEHGLWFDTMLLQRSLGEGDGTLPPGSGITTQRS